MHVHTKAAIYARVSKEKIGVTEEAKSPARQIENAKAFAAAKGWTVADAHIFADDGVSGAEFKRRPGFQRMLAAALTPRPAFQVLIVSEQKSIGREASETGYVIKRVNGIPMRHDGRALAVLRPPKRRHEKPPKFMGVS